MKVYSGRWILIVFVLCLLPVVTCSATNIFSSEQEDNDEEINQYQAGWIDWIQENNIIIDDTQYLRTGATRYYDKNLQRVGFSHFSVDMYVQFEADADYQLSAVYEKEKNEADLPVSERRPGRGRGAETIQEQPSPSGSSVYQEGGVWKN